MNREIKFRAFDKRGMFTVDVLALTACTWACPDSGRNGVSQAYQPHIHLMQWTGLKDKNNVDIYEGDIVTDDSIIDDLGSKNVGIVSFLDSAFRVTKTNCTCGECGNELLNIEYYVIGNIYQNASLIKNVTE